MQLGQCRILHMFYVLHFFLLFLFQYGDKFNWSICRFLASSCETNIPSFVSLLQCRVSFVSFRWLFFFNLWNVLQFALISLGVEFLPHLFGWPTFPWFGYFSTSLPKKLNTNYIPLYTLHCITRTNALIMTNIFHW